MVGKVSQPLFRYRRVTVWPGKHGKGDYRVEFNGNAPTHGEILTVLWWVLEAEDRYPKFGRSMLWWLIKEVYAKNGLILEDILRNADGEVAA